MFPGPEHCLRVIPYLPLSHPHPAKNVISHTQIAYTQTGNICCAIFTCFVFKKSLIKSKCRNKKTTDHCVTQIFYLGVDPEETDGE